MDTRLPHTGQIQGLTGAAMVICKGMSCCMIVALKAFLLEMHTKW